MVARMFFRKFGRFFLLGCQQGLFLRFFIRLFALGHIGNFLVKDNGKVFHEAGWRTAYLDCAPVPRDRLASITGAERGVAGKCL